MYDIKNDISLHINSLGKTLGKSFRFYTISAWEYTISAWEFFLNLFFMSEEEMYFAL